MKQLIEKYNVSVPRYTSYPTMPFWKTEAFQDWETNVKNAPQKRLSLYIHLPYCESLCTFCACHKRITKNHSYEVPYIEAVLKEWKMYVEWMGERPLIEEIHLGGGTPTFFSPENLALLIKGILEWASLPDSYEFSFEGHPNNTTYEHLKVLYDLGFRRVSFGVQDYDPQVQKAIHRIQPFEAVEKVTLAARELGYTSISHDLVFGLPFQNLEGFTETVKKTLSLNPDRLSLYSYAHVPWIKGIGQRGYSEEDLPAGEQKRTLYEMARELYEANGYYEVGMDHFAKANDKMFQAYQEGTLNRNFMGYTTTNSPLLIGLGASAISDVWSAMAQNEKNVEEYLRMVNEGKIPVVKGHLQSEEDLQRRQIIHDIMCKFRAEWPDEFWNEELERQLEELRTDGILQYTPTSLEVTELGKAFIRNVCVVFDAYLRPGQALSKTFSKAI
ncbi:oxygen-independent coproporphyrinogen III oxidase [Leadbetterella byssophila]|uniref:oxygen-independent coproporphyrinogen III oxidase n=1 Tax=Leadbetterella byssophila TaxID=316068 RepID=UPI0039A0E247